MSKYIPDIYQKSIYTVNYSKLYSDGIKCLLFDLDNTLISSKSLGVSEKTKDLIISLKQKGFKVIILSNSPKKKVKKFGEFLEVPYYYFALKPLSFKFKKALSDFHYLPKEVAIIGDQIMTDVVGGNKVGITTILVNPVADKDVIFTKFNRFFEKRKIKELENNNLFKRGNYYE